MNEHEHEHEHEHEAVVTVAFQTTTADAWKCLERSGIYAGALIGETLILGVDVLLPTE